MPELADALAFEVTCFWFRVRDAFSPPRLALSSAGIERGAHVLDYGCGPGSYAFAAAELVGEGGRVYAADINPLAIRRVRAVAEKRGFQNVRAIRTDCATGLETGGIDIALLYDTYHDLADPGAVLKELRRVLKPGGVLSFSDHHLQEEEILAAITGSGLFTFLRKGGKTFTFQAKG